MGVQAVRCADSFFYYAEGCAVCPADSYCRNGTRTDCGANLTSPAAGSSPLECAPRTAEVAQHFGVDLLLQVGGSHPTFCVEVAQAVQHWLLYGSLIGCQASVANYSSSVLGLQCSIQAPQQYSAEYAQWLGQALQAQRSWIEGFLQGCLQTPKLMLLDAISMPILPISAQPSTNTSWSVPQLLYEPRRWGQGQADVVVLLGSVLMLSFAICLSMGLLCGGLLLSSARSRSQPSSWRGSRCFGCRTGTACPCSWL